MAHTSSPAPLTIPLVLHVGFAGSRKPCDFLGCSDATRERMEQQLADALVVQLRRLPGLLGLSPHHMLVGVSQIAIGSDSAFTRACQTLGIPQRIFLAQPREAYLAARGEDGSVDFDAPQQAAARELLASAHIIEECVASHAAERGVRFAETNARILRASDIVIGVLARGADGKPGGTADLLTQAEALGLPVATIALESVDGAVHVPPLKPLAHWTNGAAFSVPAMPSELAGLSIAASQREGWPSARSYIERIHGFSGARSSAHGGRFKRSAVSIIGLHLLATALALSVGKFQPIALFLLGGESLMLCAGLAAHVFLHHSGRTRAWAVSRLVAEITRSLAEVERFGGTLEYPLALALPDALVPVLRTSAVLQLIDRARTGIGDWRARRADYLQRRLAGPAAQLAYYAAQGAAAARRLKIVTALFWICSCAAIGVTFAEMLAHAGRLPAGPLHFIEHWGLFLGVILPVGAIGGLSWSAAGDLEARVHTFAQMHQYLSRQLTRLRAAGSECEFELLMRETEQRLLGENLNWFSRRFYTSVA